MKIGITERGDAGLNLVWKDKLKTLNGAILITKNLTNEFIWHVLRNQDVPIIIHVTCTGYGGSELEPNVPLMDYQFKKTVELINKGFPASNIVLRIDPIFPTEKGLFKAKQVIECYKRTLYFMNVNRIRVSILDEYKHVKQRFINKGWYAIYGNNQFASDEQIQSVAELLGEYPDITFETCAESKLAAFSKGNIQEIGCISVKDLDIMEINHEGLAMYENPQHRAGCHCLSCKTELLENKHRCPHGCEYCYWY